MFGVLVTEARVSAIILYKNTTRNAVTFLFFLLFGNYPRNCRTGDKHGCCGNYDYICCCGYVSSSRIHRSQKCKWHENYLLSHYFCIIISLFSLNFNSFCGNKAKINFIAVQKIFRPNFQRTGLPFRIFKIYYLYCRRLNQKKKKRKFLWIAYSTVN